MREGFLLYGANGYTGRLIVEASLRMGLAPTLAGRRREAVEPIARDHGLPFEIVSLEDRAGLVRILSRHRALLLAAGPFSRTSDPALEACLAAKASYLDITGEIAVFEAVFARHEEASRAGVTLLPGVGFDVVPSDGLAALLAAALPGAVRLQLAFRGFKTSAGTAKTMLEGVPRGGMARVLGELVPVPAAWKTLEVPFADRTRLCVSIPWGDLSTAWRSTGIPNIETYIAMPRAQVQAMRLLRPLLRFAGVEPVRGLLAGLVERTVSGPTADERARERSQLWGRVEDPAGSAVTGTVQTLEGYSLTAEAAVAAVARVLTGRVPPGAWTPSRALGLEFLPSLPSTTVRVPA